MHPVLRFFETHERRGLGGAGERREPQQAQRAFGQYAGRDCGAAFLEPEFDLAQGFHLHFDPADIRREQGERPLDDPESVRLHRLECSKECRDHPSCPAAALRTSRIAFAARIHSRGSK